MQLTVNGIDTFVATGGREFDKSLPAIVLLHGAGFDHTTWALHRGGSRITVLACWRRTCRAMAAPAARRSPPSPTWRTGPRHCSMRPALPTARLVGHSMGSLIALETAARHPAKVSALEPDRNGGDHDGRPRSAQGRRSQRSMRRSTWSRSGASAFRPNSAAASRPACGCITARSGCSNSAGPACCSTISAACNAYQGALAAAAQITVPATLILGERDMMTPARAGKALAAALPNSRTVVLPGAGHMMMVERPDELLAALQG